MDYVIPLFRRLIFKARRLALTTYSCKSLYLRWRLSLLKLLTNNANIWISWIPTPESPDITTSACDWTASLPKPWNIVNVLQFVRNVKIFLESRPPMVRLRLARNNNTEIKIRLVNFSALNYTVHGIRHTGNQKKTPVNVPKHGNFLVSSDNSRFKPRLARQLNLNIIHKK